MISIASGIVSGVEAYLVVGAAIAIAFVAFGLERVMPAARGAYAFRPLIMPGLILLWPLVLLRWWCLSAVMERPDKTQNEAPVQNSQGRLHRVIWVCLALFLSVALVFAWTLRHPSLPIPLVERLSASNFSLPTLSPPTLETAP